MTEAFSMDNYRLAYGADELSKQQIAFASHNQGLMDGPSLGSLPESPLQATLVAMEEALTKTSQLVEMLGARLHPVLRDSFNESVDPVPSQAPDCQMIFVLRTLQQHIEVINVTLFWYLERLAL